MLSEGQADPVSGPIVPTFFRFVLPSMMSLLAISTASVVDGFFVGNYVGSDALAAVNLLMPYFTIWFGMALMLAVGGCVKAGAYLAQENVDAASAIFTRVFLVVMSSSLMVIPIVLVFEESLFLLLGADSSLYPLMSEYFRILCVAMVLQLCALILYYFVRVDNFGSIGFCRGQH